MWLGLLLALIVGSLIGSYQFIKEHGLKWSMVIGSLGFTFFLIYGYLWVVKSESAFKTISLDIGVVLGLLCFGAYFLDDWLLKKKDSAGIASASSTSSKKKKISPKRGKATRGGGRGWL